MGNANEHLAFRVQSLKSHTAVPSLDPGEQTVESQFCVHQTALAIVPAWENVPLAWQKPTSSILVLLPKSWSLRGHNTNVATCNTTSTSPQHFTTHSLAAFEPVLQRLKCSVSQLQHSAMVLTQKVSYSLAVALVVTQGMQCYSHNIQTSDTIYTWHCIFCLYIPNKSSASKLLLAELLTHQTSHIEEI